jgi:hypothetical protein
VIVLGGIDGDPPEFVATLRRRIEPMEARLRALVASGEPLAGMAVLSVDDAMPQFDQWLSAIVRQGGARGTKMRRDAKRAGYMTVVLARDGFEHVGQAFPPFAGWMRNLAIGEVPCLVISELVLFCTVRLDPPARTGLN